MRKLSLYETDPSKDENIAYHGLDAMRVISSFGVVFLHVCVVTGVPGSLEWLLRFRDFALPVMVLSSFFVLTTSILQRRKSGTENDFGVFLGRRVSRLFLPFFVWTCFYVLFIVFLAPLAMGKPPALEGFSALVFITGYWHLWYLQFLFTGSLIAYPFILRLSGHESFSVTRVFPICAGVTVLYACFYHLNLSQKIQQMLDSQPDTNLHTFAVQTSHYLLFVPVAIGLGFISPKVTELLKNPFYRRVSLLIAFVAMLLHVRSFPFAGSQEIYALTVFLAALQPWKKVPYKFWQKLTEHSYGVYILHIFWVNLLWFYIAYDKPEITAGLVLCAVPVVYLLSFVSTFLLRKICPADWLLPLVGEKAPAASHLQILRLSLAHEK